MAKFGIVAQIKNKKNQQHLKTLTTQAVCCVQNNSMKKTINDKLYRQSKRMKSQISTVLVGWMVLPVHFYVKWFSMSSSFDVQYFFFFYCLAIAFIVIHALEKLPTTTHLFNCMNPIAHCESDRETTHNIDFDNIWRWHSSVAWFFLKLFFLLLIWPIVVCSDLFLFFIRFLCYIGNIDMSSVSMVRNRLRNQKAPIHVKYRRCIERGRSCFAVFFVVFFVTLSSLANWKLLIVWSRLDKSLMTKHDSLWTNWLF